MVIKSGMELMELIVLPLRGRRGVGGRGEVEGRRGGGKKEVAGRG